MCLSLCVAKDFANRVTDKALLYWDTSHGRFMTIYGWRIPPPRKRNCTWKKGPNLKKLLSFSFENYDLTWSTEPNLYRAFPLFKNIQSIQASNFLGLVAADARLPSLGIVY